MKNSKINLKNVNLVLILIFPMIFLSFGLKKQNEIHEKLMIQGIGIDLLDNKYKVTVQAYDFKNPENKDEPKIKIIESESETVSSALQNIKKITGLYPMYSQNKLIVISEDIARKGVKNIIDFFLRFYENRPSVKLRTSKLKAEDIFKTKIDDKLIKASEIKDLVDEKFDVNILEFERALESKILSPVSFLIDKKENGQIICENIALFRDDKLVKMLSKNETLGVKILKSHSKTGVCNVELNDHNFISFELENVNTKIKLNIDENEHIKFYIDIQVSCDLIETTKVFDDTKDMINESKDAIDRHLKQICEEAINASIVEKCDILKFGKIIRNNNPNIFKKVQFEDYLSKAEYYIKVDSKVSMVGIENK